jgi:hypothetical protein
MAVRNEPQRYSCSEGGVGRLEANHPEVLGMAWGPELALGGRQARAQEAHGGLGNFSPDARARPQREVVADRWATMAHGTQQVVAHRERERESRRVWPVKKEIDFEYRKLFSIQCRTENNSKEIARCL